MALWENGKRRKKIKCQMNKTYVFRAEAFHLIATLLVIVRVFSYQI